MSKKKDNEIEIPDLTEFDYKMLDLVELLEKYTKENPEDKTFDNIVLSVADKNNNSFSDISKKKISKVNIRKLLQIYNSDKLKVKFISSKKYNKGEFKSHFPEIYYPEIYNHIVYEYIFVFID